jgi:hypothetical protein
LKVDIKRAFSPTAQAMKAEAAASRLGANMLRTVDMFVREERNTHRYQNRTGAAEKSTRAELEVGDGAAVVTAYMDAINPRDGFPYPLVLQADGWSRFDDLMKQAERAVDRTIEVTFEGLETDSGE